MLREHDRFRSERLNLCWRPRTFPRFSGSTWELFLFYLARELRMHTANLHRPTGNRKTPAAVVRSHVFVGRPLIEGNNAVLHYAAGLGTREVSGGLFSCLQLPLTRINANKSCTLWMWVYDHLEKLHTSISSSFILSLKIVPTAV